MTPTGSAWRVRSAHGLVLDFTLDESDEAIEAARDFARKDQLNAYIIDLGTGTGSTVHPDGRITEFSDKPTRRKVT